MSNTNTNGGPSVEVPPQPGQGWQEMAPCGGIDLRDYFAGQAISQIIAVCANDTTHGMTEADYFACRAYEIADAMLKARGDTE